MNASTVGFNSPAFTALNVSFDLRLSNTSSRWYRTDYTVDGTNWTLGNPTRLGVAANSGDTWFQNLSLDINDISALNNSSFGFRVVSVFSTDAFTEANSSTNFLANSAYEVARNTTSTYNSSGTWRFDNVTLSAVPEPGTWLLIGLGAAVVLHRLRRKQA